MGHERIGFTLLELLAVVAILCLVAMIATTRLGGRGEARLRQAEALVTRADAMARLASERLRQASRVRISLSQARLSIESEGKRETPEVSLPPGVLVKRVITQAEDRSSGEVLVRVGSGGDSYGVCLESSDGKSRWLVFAGGSGCRLMGDADPSSDQEAIRDEEVEAFFRSLRKNRADAR